ncbi:hypothetical protein ACFFRR_008048 [Megaselia abdita]
MDLSIERDSTAIGSLFQLIINDLKNTSPLWDDFVAKASKLHACLRAAIQAIASYLDAFQKIADAATNSRGASKEIGTALTRVCLRHKAVETRLKTFTTAIMDCLVLPLQDKIEDWKRQVSIIDKEHAKEYKRCRSELKKRSTDTLRLQKKARKGQADSIQSLMDSHMHDVTLRRAELEEVEKKSLRAAMIEERTRYCAFVNLLQPVVKEECEVMFELGHLQEAMQSIAIVTKDPSTLPQASEELIMDAKSNMNLYPESPGGNSGSHGCSNSLGSRKSSVCSISSINSSGSSGSPGHHYQRSISQFISPSIRLKPGESSDSGFCSSPALTLQTPSTTNQSSNAVSTWPPHSPDNGCNSDRPHTISSTYEKGHQRPALTVYTFQNPETIQENAQMTAQKSPACRPPLPVRCSSLERPLSANNRVNNANLMTRQCPSPIPPHISKELPQQSATQQPTYVNMSELANMAALKITNNCSSVPQPPEKPERHNIPPKPPHQQLQHQQSTDSHSSLSSSHISSPEHSKTLSLASHDSAAGTPTGSGAPITTPSASSTCASTEISTPTNNEDDFDKTTTTENTNEILGSGDGGCSDDNNILKITETDSISITNTSNCTPTPSTTNTSSPTTPSVEKDDPIVTRGSVLQKTSMFEKAAQSSVAKNVESIYGVRKEEKVPAADTKDSNVDQIYEDSIQELNNLIGELDSFQREHEAKEKLRKYSTTNNHLNQIPVVNGNSGVGGMTIFGTSDAESDKISIGSLNYSTHSTKYSDSEISRYVSETSSLGFENPTFAHLNTTTTTSTSNTTNNQFTPIHDNNSDSGSNIVMIYDHQYIPDPEYVKQNTEIVVLRSKENDNCQDKVHKATHNNNITDSPKHRLSSFRTSTSSEHHQNNHLHQQHDNNNSFKPGTRIARRSSVNSMKPPPPVRRSSSVTPSHNLSQSSSPNVVQQQQHGIMTNSTESLPPPPAYLLDQQQKQQQQSSSIKVSETVKALSALKHTPASPNAIRRMQSPQQTTSIQSLQSNNIYSCSPTTNTQPLSSPPPVNNLHAPFQQQLQQNNTYYCNNNVHKKADIPPPLPPPNPTMQQKTQSAIIHDKSNYQNSFRTANSASPNIYGTHRQMSSFRCSSPNGPTIVAPQPIYHANPPAQPKTNPNLIAQLNARINKQSTGGDESNIYGNSPQYYQQSESIYGRSRAQQHQLQQQQQQQQQHQQPQYDGKNHIYGNCNSNFSSSHSSNPNHSQYYNHHYREHHSCPPPLNNPPPPPIATMPKKPQRINYQQHHHQQQQQSQQSHHQQPQMYMSSSSSTTNIAGNSQLRQPHNSQQQYQTLQHPMRHKKQPPVPQRHSSVQQKIFVSTNPFIHTTTVNCNSSPSSPSGGYYHPHHQSDTSGGGGVPSGIQTMRPKQHAHLPQPQYVTSNNPNYSSQTLDKTGNSKVKKHEFLENLNAKLAKQGISNKAFAVRSLINSKALPDPRKCHESLMDQIKRGATLKRNQKINDRSAPKIH